MRNYFKIIKKKKFIFKFFILVFINVKDFIF
jgi:hypothetical protein